MMSIILYIYVLCEPKNEPHPILPLEFWASSVGFGREDDFLFVGEAPNNRYTTTVVLIGSAQDKNIQETNRFAFFMKETCERTRSLKQTIFFLPRNTVLSCRKAPAR